MKKEYVSRAVRFQAYLNERLQVLTEEGRRVPKNIIVVPELGLRPIISDQLIVRVEKPLRVGREVKLLETGRPRAGRQKRTADVRISHVCHCNSNLYLLEGKDVHLLTGKVKFSPDTETLPPVKGSSTNNVHLPPIITRPVSGLDTSRNDSKELFEQQIQRIEEESVGLANHCTVAVMDTGIDFGYPNTKAIPIKYNGGERSCDDAQPDYFGWDFVNNHNNPYDDAEKSKHGSRIAAIINKTAKKTAKKIQILPLKVLNSEGFGTLFDIFCGFEYLLSDRLKNQVKIINASWGFYGVKNSLMEEYIELLRTNGMWLVNAAGNMGDVVPNQTVNLDRVPRFPARYSRQFSNVVTITTVSNDILKRKPGGTQFKVVENYSPTFVNVGVGSGLDGKFKEPLVDTNSPAIDGSSYATPYVSALIAGSYSKPTLISQQGLFDQIPGIEKVESLSDRIHNGYVVEVETDLPVT